MPTTIKCIRGFWTADFNCWAAFCPAPARVFNTYVPMGIDQVQVYGPPQAAAWCRAWLRSLKGKVAVGDIQFLDDSAAVLVKLEGVRLRRVPRDWLARWLAGPLPDWCYELAWAGQPLDVAASESPDGEPGQWLVFDSPDGLGCRRGRAAGDESPPLCPRAGRRRSRSSPSGGAPVFGRQRAETPRGGLSLDLEVDGRHQSPDFVAARQRGWGGVLDVLHVLAESGGAEPPRLWLVTRGAQAVDNHPGRSAWHSRPFGAWVA